MQTTVPLAPKTKPSAKAILAAVIGNGLEFYDFGIYSYFAVTIGRQFFPASTPTASLLLSLATFGVGFISRPLGSIIIGGYADRVGRKPAMVLTLALMALGMLMLALTPSYATIGLAAPASIVAARIIQGFALGGEVGPSSAFLIEAAPKGKRGLYGSWQRASQGGAVLVAGLVGVMMSALLSPADMDSWGWRIPFLLGIAIVPVGLYVRRQLPETLETRHPQEAGVLVTLFTKQRRPLALGFVLTLSTGVSTYVGNYMTTYAYTTLKLDAGVALTATLVLGLATLIAAPISGWLGDRHGRKPVLICCRLLYMAAAYPAFLLLNRYPASGMLIAMVALLATLDALSASIGLVLIPENFPKSVRSTGMAISYAVALVISGSSTQVVIAWVIDATGNPLSPAWFVIVAGTVGLLAMFLAKETRDIDINQ